MPAWLTEPEYRTLEAALDRLVPPGPEDPATGEPAAGAREAGVAGYLDTLLGAFTFHPPRIWAGGPTSGRAGGEAAFGRFHELGALDELAWRTRIEGSQGRPEREFNGPVVGLQQRYREGLASLGGDFAEVGPEAQDERLEAAGAFTELLYEHACEGMYGAPEYGGNRDLAGWRGIGFAGDVQPRGWTDAEVTSPEVTGPEAAGR
ncbi:MAG: gluconate 2-dehydrogenase subunit 3 family protein [Acidimicrobiales bacterium]